MAGHAGLGDHLPVLLRQVVELLDPRPGGVYLDGTLGLGGHAAAVLQAAGTEARLIGLDRDRKTLEEASRRLAEAYGDRVQTFWTSFARFETPLEEAGVQRLDGALLDLGVSSIQLDTPERGFSFLAEGPLDMRMDPEAGGEPAANLVNRASFERLAAIIGQLGEEPQAGRIARAIIREREEAPIETTSRLADIVVRAYPPKWRREARNHPATRTFQGLRMAVNDELGQLQAFLDRIVDWLAPGGRLAVIAFHSLEDRMVKHFFRDEAKGCICPPRQPLCTCGHQPRLRILTKKPVMADEAELAANPRSRSAKLRAAQRLAYADSDGAAEAAAPGGQG